MPGYIKIKKRDQELGRISGTESIFEFPDAKALHNNPEPTQRNTLVVYGISCWGECKRNLLYWKHGLDFNALHLAGDMLSTLPSPSSLPWPAFSMSLTFYSQDETVACLARFCDRVASRPHPRPKIKEPYITFESIRFEPYFNKRRHSTCQRVAIQSGCKMHHPRMLLSAFFMPRSILTLFFKIFFFLSFSAYFPVLQTYFSSVKISFASTLHKKSKRNGVTHLNCDMWCLPALLCDGQGWKFCIIYVEREMWKFCLNTLSVSVPFVSGEHTLWLQERINIIFTKTHFAY